MYININITQYESNYIMAIQDSCFCFFLCGIIFMVILRFVSKERLYKETLYIF